ncbi:MAG: sulfatase [Verrucomicrobiae bacterium]|nr:sulfatase [Verrucomicrobiae bacterium]
MIRFPLLSSLFLAAAAAWLSTSPTAAAADKPVNVLFLICDDLNCDLACYGHPQVKSPNIDRLAARGVRFDRAYCQYPLCGPSRASFLCGMYPDQTLIHRNAIYVREHVPNVKTLPQMFRDAGYFATRIGKLYHYNVPNHIGTSGHDDPDSWNYTINPRGRDKDDESDIFTLVPGTFGGTLSWLAAEGTDEEQTDGIAAEEAAEQLEKYAKKGTPFFLAVGLYRPHTPYVSPKKYFDLYPTESIKVPTEPEGYLDTLPNPAKQSIRRKKDQIDLPEKLAKEAIQAYHASITFADAQLGKILDSLEKNGLADNTVILFTSDHGYHMGEHGHWQKTTLFENATRVPLIISGAGIENAGAVVKTPVEMVDFYPTLAELCGLKAPPSAAGVSLVPALKDPSVAPREAALSQYNQGYSLRTPRWRYTEWGENGEEGKELYDHESDPEEMVNLAGKTEQAETISKLAEQLHARIEEANREPKGVKQIRFENNRKVPR